VLDELAKLLEIQKLDQKIERLDHKLAEVPLGIQSVQADLLSKRVRLDGVVSRIAETDKKKRKLELDIEEGKERAIKLDGQLMSVKTNHEYRAMLSQIQTLRDQSSDKETEILMLLEQIDALNGEKREAQNEFQTFEAVAKTEIGERTKHGDVLRRDREAAATRRSELAASLDKKLSGLYEKIRKKWGNNAIVELHGEICGGCHLSLRPQHAGFVRQGKEIYTCENCHRILYQPDKPAPEANPATEAQEQVSS
jgi:uncharacterized protein